MKVFVYKDFYDGLFVKRGQEIDVPAEKAQGLIAAGIVRPVFQVEAAPEPAEVLPVAAPEPAEAVPAAAPTPEAPKPKAVKKARKTTDLL